MGLMDKIEDKLHKGKKTDDTTTSSEYGNSHSNTSNTHGTHGRDEYSSTTGSDKYGTDSSHGSGLTGSHNTASSGMTGSHHTPGTTSNTYGSSGSHVPGYGNTTTSSGGLGSHHDPKSGWLEDETGRGTHGSHGVSSRDHVGRDGYDSNSRDTHNSSSAYDNSGRGYTGPASNTIGPHSSNAANVVDPRVQPAPEQMKDRHTTGPHNSDMMNKMDPRVDANAYNSSSGYGSNTQTGGFESGPHGRLENRGSIPTAGGTKVGSGGYDDGYNSSSRNPMSSEPHSSSHHGHSGHYGAGGHDEGYNSSSHNPMSSEPHSSSHHGHSGHHGAGGLTDPSMTGSGGIAPERKMGGAYEAGYRDAMQHMEAERR